VNYRDRDIPRVVAELDLLKERIQNESLGCLTLNDLGTVFGNEFWNLIYPVEIRVVVEQGRR